MRVAYGLSGDPTPKWGLEVAPAMRSQREGYVVTYGIIMMSAPNVAREIMPPLRAETHGTNFIAITEEKMQEELFVPDTPSGRTSPEPLVQIMEKISERSSKASPKSPKKRFQYLCLKTGDGSQPDWLRAMDGQSHGEHLTPNFGASPSVANASSLSQILEATVHPKYFLSAKACLGILRRAETRGKKLPEALREALERQSALNLVHKTENPE